MLPDRAFEVNYLDTNFLLHLLVGSWLLKGTYIHKTEMDIMKVQVLHIHLENVKTLVAILAMYVICDI